MHVILYSLLPARLPLWYISVGAAVFVFKAAPEVCRGTMMRLSASGCRGAKKINPVLGPIGPVFGDRWDHGRFQGNLAELWIAQKLSGMHTFNFLRLTPIKSGAYNYRKS